MTLEEVKEYLQVYYEDDDNFIKELINVAQIYIDSMVGEAYKSNEKAVNLANIALKKIIHDMYDNRSAAIDNKTKESFIVSSIFDKLAIYGWGEADD